MKPMNIQKTQPNARSRRFKTKYANASGMEKYDIAITRSEPTCSQINSGRQSRQKPCGERSVLLKIPANKFIQMSPGVVTKPASAFQRLGAGSHLFTRPTHRIWQSSIARLPKNFRKNFSNVGTLNLAKALRYWRSAPSDSKRGSHINDGGTAANIGHRRRPGSA